ncbi:MAG TPA: hypothetical protein VGT78_11275 [Rhizomicrobium sp.]|nr:hypothetical protein [Rhizomicrobium sp.]
MEKIPVGQSIGGAYGFLFGRILTIIGLSWLPAVFYAVARLFFIQHASAGMLAAMHGQSVPLQDHLFHLGFFLFFILLISIIAVSLTREALGLGGERVLAHFVIGGKEIRLFFALVRFYILLIVLIVALVILVVAVGMATKTALAQGMVPAQWPVQHAALGLAMLLACLAVLFVVLRLTFLLAPVTVAEEHAKLSRAWSLSAGNFWRMLAIFLACAVPVFLILVAAEYALLGPQLRDIAHQMWTSGKHPDPDVLYRMSQDNILPLVAIATVGLVVLSALFAGASAAAYRALVPLPEPQAPQEEQEPYVAETPMMAPIAHHDNAHHDDHGPANGQDTHDHGHDDHAHEAHDDTPEHADAHGNDEPPAQETSAQEAHADDHAPAAGNTGGHGDDHGHGADDHAGQKNRAHSDHEEDDPPAHH